MSTESERAVVPVTGLPSAAPRWSSAADHPDRALTAHPASAEARGEDLPDQVEAPMQVPMTVRLPSRWFTPRVVTK
jgi:hypothetical protein